MGLFVTPIGFGHALSFTSFATTFTPDPGGSDNRYYVTMCTIKGANIPDITIAGVPIPRLFLITVGSWSIAAYVITDSALGKPPDGVSQTMILSHASVVPYTRWFKYQVSDSGRFLADVDSQYFVAQSGANVTVDVKDDYSVALQAFIYEGDTTITYGDGQTQLSFVYNSTALASVGSCYSFHIHGAQTLNITWGASGNSLYAALLVSSWSNRGTRRAV